MNDWFKISKLILIKNKNIKEIDSVKNWLHPFNDQFLYWLLGS